MAKPFPLTRLLNFLSRNEESIRPKIGLSVWIIFWFWFGDVYSNYVPSGSLVNYASYLLPWISYFLIGYAELGNEKSTVFHNEIVFFFFFNINRRLYAFFSISKWQEDRIFLNYMQNGITWSKKISMIQFLWWYNFLQLVMGFMLFSLKKFPNFPWNMKINNITIFF